ANVGKCLMDHPETTPENLREDSEAALKEATELFQRWNGKKNDRIRASYAPRFVVSCTEKLLRDVLTLSKRQNALIHTHASENLKEIQLVKRLVNCENIEYLHQLGLTGPNLVLAHCIWLKPNEKEILSQTKTHIVHCPSSNLKLASGLAHIPDLMGRGIEIALGADGAPCNNNLNMFLEMRLAALIHKPGVGPRAVRAQEVLDMATRNGAKALQWWNDIGSIEVGKKADLTALNLSEITNFVPERSVLDPEAIASSVVYSCGPSDVKFTMVDGKILYRNGRVIGLPKDSLIKQYRAAQNTVFKRVKAQISP
ncbi:MAG: amidohydrolase family protein, partial [Bdellovibrionota bacterium]